ncbi:hypothetical protein B296_00059112, partial [Ensete ventricosum]
NILAYGKLYEHDFTRKCDGHKLCLKLVTRKVEFRSVFCAPSQNFKVLAIPNVLAHGKLYEHGFAKNMTVINFAREKKYDGHKLCAKARAKLSFDRFFMHHLGI